MSHGYSLLTNADDPNEREILERTWGNTQQVDVLIPNGATSALVTKKHITRVQDVARVWAVVLTVQADTSLLTAGDALRVGPYIWLGVGLARFRIANVARVLTITPVSPLPPHPPLPPP